MVRRCILCMMLGLATSVAALSQHLSGYELEREMPVFLDQLKAELTYPMAWRTPSCHTGNVSLHTTGNSVLRHV